MLNDPNFRITFIPFLLRLTLAVIFIFHGVSKIATPRNDWGLAWATNMWQKEGTVPKAPMAKLNEGLERLKKDRVAMEKEAQELKAEGEKLGEGQAKEDNAKKQEENAKRQEENTARQTEFREAEEKIKAAFAAGTTLPDALGYQGMQFAVAWGELLCGVAMLLGLFTRLAAAGLVIIMIGAIYMVTGAQGFSNPVGGGYEYNLAILAMCAVLIIKGAGPLSLDGWLESRRKSAHHHQQQPVAV